MVEKTMIILTAAMAALCPPATADGPGRIYTTPAAEDTGSITGKVQGAALTHALAVERDRKRVYLAKLENGGSGFRFDKLPVGRFDLVMVTRDNRVVEGLELGAKPQLSAGSEQNLEAGVAKADSFFNRHVIQRSGVSGGAALVFTERIRDGTILRGSGERVNAFLRRLEIIELREAADDWQMVGTRHLYREETPLVKGIPFMKHQYLQSLGSLRLAGRARDLGIIDLTKSETSASP